MKHYTQSLEQAKKALDNWKAGKCNKTEVSASLKLFLQDAHISKLEEQIGTPVSPDDIINTEVLQVMNLSESAKELAIANHGLCSLAQAAYMDAFSDHVLARCERKTGALKWLGELFAKQKCAIAYDGVVSAYKKHGKLSNIDAHRYASNFVNLLEKEIDKIEERVHSR